MLTVVALSDAILYSSSFCEVGDFGPVFVGIRAGTERTACAMGCRVLLWSGLRGILRIGVARSPMQI